MNEVLLRLTNGLDP